MPFQLDLSRLSCHPSIVKSLTGLSWEKFQDLIPVFRDALWEVKKAQKWRQRAPGAGSKGGALDTDEKKLFFVLFYLKVYPTLRVQAFLFGKPSGKLAAELRLLREALEKALGKKMVLPKRKVNSSEELIAAFPDVAEIMVDGMERPIQRPSGGKRQRNHYSGKKKRHTRKHVVMTDGKRKILGLSPAKAGRRHDQRLLDKAGWMRHIPPDWLVLADSAFSKIKRGHANTWVPKRKSKNHPLTPEDKETNRIISSFRVAVEHGIGGMKRYGVMSQRLRNRIGEFDDQTALLAAGLWNFAIA